MLWNAQKWKKKPFDILRSSRIALSQSGEAQPYLLHVNPRVPRSVHAKFPADWTKIVDTRVIHMEKHLDRQTNRPILV